MKKKSIKLNTWVAVSLHMEKCFFLLGTIKSNLDLSNWNHFFHVSFVLFSLVLISFLAIFYLYFLLKDSFVSTVITYSVHINNELQELTSNSCSWIVEASYMCCGSCRVHSCLDALKFFWVIPLYVAKHSLSQMSIQDHCYQLLNSFFVSCFSLP